MHRNILCMHGNHEIAEKCLGVLYLIWESFSFIQQERGGGGGGGPKVEATERNSLDSIPLRFRVVPTNRQTSSAHS